jgi:hypothetical protein
MDADDLVDSRRLEAQLHRLEGDSSIDLIDTGCVMIDANNHPIGSRGTTAQSMTNARALLTHGLLLHASVVGRREWFRRFPYDSRYDRAEDREVFARAFPSSRFDHLPEPFYFYFFHGNVRLRPFLTSYLKERAVLRRYGPALIGNIATMRLYLRSLLKSLVLPLLVFTGRANLVGTRNFEGLTNVQEAEIRNAISRIVSIEIPGIAES